MLGLGSKSLRSSKSEVAMCYGIDVRVTLPKFDQHGWQTIQAKKISTILAVIMTLTKQGIRGGCVHLFLLICFQITYTNQSVLE